MAPRRLPALGLALAAALAACGAGPSPAATDLASRPSPTLPTTEPAAEPPPAFPATVIDDADRQVMIETEPMRIVSLAPSNTEIVCALEACDRLVGVPEFRDGYPPDVLETVADLPVVVAFGPVDLEQVVASEPDLVLAAGNELTASSDIAAIDALGIPVLVLYPESLDEVGADIAMVGAALGRTDRAAEVIDGIERTVDEVTDAVAGAERPRTFYEVGLFEGTIYTAGEGSFLASLIELAGGDPITGDAVSTAIGLEDLVAADPELILLGDAAYDPSITPESVAQRDGWGEMSAVRDGRVVVVAEDILVTRPGPRIAEGLEALARHVHPDAFGAGLP